MSLREQIALVVFHAIGSAVAGEAGVPAKAANAIMNLVADATRSVVTATGVSADPGGTETKPEQNLHEKGEG